MTKQTITVKGAESLSRTLRAAGKSMQDMDSQHAAAGALVARAASGRAPRRTGTLAASLDVVTSPTGAEVLSSARYAAPVESGVPSRGQAARPFLRNTLDDSADAITDLYAKRVDAIIRTVKGV